MRRLRLQPDAPSRAAPLHRLNGSFRKESAWLVSLALVLGLAGCGGRRPWPTRPVASGPPASAVDNRTVVMLPLVNVAGADARGLVVQELQKRLEAKGYVLASAEGVEKFLEEKRIRYLDSFSSETIDLLRARFGAAYVFSGALLTWLDGAPNPVMAIEARLWGARGATAWWELASITPSDTSGVLDLGRLPTRDQLLAELLDRLMRTLPAPGEPGEVRGPRGPPLLSSGPVTYRSPRLAPGGNRVMVLPFANATTDKRASWLATELTGRALEASGRFRIVEPAELRRALIEQGLRSFLELGPSELRALGHRVGTPYFLQGTVYVFREVSPFNERVVPHVELQLSLIDAENYRVLWTTQHGRSGDAYEGAFEQGRITNAVELLAQVIAEVVDDEGHRARSAQPPTSPARDTP